MFLLYTIWFVVVFGGVVIVAVLACIALAALVKGNRTVAVICALGILAFPAYHVWDIGRGVWLGKRFETVIVAPWSSGEPRRPVVLVLGDAAHCGHICREILARGYLDSLLQVGERPIGGGPPEKICTHRSDTTSVCHDMRDTRRRMQPPTKEEQDKLRSSIYADYMPHDYTRITFSNVPYPRVYDAGFPRLTSSIGSGSFFLLVEEVVAGQPRLIAQAFRLVRQPAAIIWGLQFLGEPFSEKQVVGAPVTYNEALNKIMGWNLQGRMPKHDPKPTRRLPPGTKTKLVCQERPLRCELQPVN